MVNLSIISINHLDENPEGSMVINSPILQRGLSRVEAAISYLALIIPGIASVQEPLMPNLVTHLQYVCKIRSYFTYFHSPFFYEI